MVSFNNAIRTSAENARQFVYRVLAFHIRNMILLPDEKLSEEETSTQLGVSRTPVHDTFAQLSREKMLVVESRRSTFVPRLDAAHIRQLVWMNRTTTIGVLENLYTIRQPKDRLEVLQHIVNAEMAALGDGDFAQMAKLDAKFYLELYGMAGFLPLYRTLWRNSVDLYRLSRMDDNPEYWVNMVTQHAAIYRALSRHDHESACNAVMQQYAAVESLLAKMRVKYPQYFKPQPVAQ